MEFVDGGFLLLNSLSADASARVTWTEEQVCLAACALRAYLSDVLQRFGGDGEVDRTRLELPVLRLFTGQGRFRVKVSRYQGDFMENRQHHDECARSYLTMNHELTCLGQVFGQERPLHITTQSVLE